MVSFITGFPGFIAKSLVRALIKRDPHSQLILLIHPSMVENAQKEQLPSSCKLMVGDITKLELGLPPEISRQILEETDTVYHLAAIYDLAVDKKVATQVNVMGTKNIIDFFKKAHQLKHFNYISTCYVAGKLSGEITSDMLQSEQGFYNHYESTKNAAEVIVKHHMQNLPITIFRPAIVVGNSQTGETDKFDGPYVVLKFLHKIRWFLRCVPNLGHPHCEVNTIPVDYLVNVLIALGLETSSIGKTYQVCDQNPPSTERFFSDMVYMIGGSPPLKVPFLRFLILKLLRFPGVSKITGISCQALDYFSHPGRFRCHHLHKDLKESSIVLPHYTDYYPKLYHYMVEKG